jgi:hypothetical protein
MHDINLIRFGLLPVRLILEAMNLFGFYFQSLKVYSLNMASGRSAKIDPLTIVL